MGILPGQVLHHGFGGEEAHHPGCMIDVHGHAAASIARKVYLRQGLGVGLMRRQYGGRKSRGTCPERFEKSAGGLIRHILQVGHSGLRGMNPPLPLIATCCLSFSQAPLSQDNWW